MLKHALDRHPVPGKTPTALRDVPHGHVRGPRSSHEKGSTPLRTHPTVETLPAVTRTGRRKAWSDQMPRPEGGALRVAARRGWLVDRERTARPARRLTTRLRQATWRRSAALEEGDSRPPRGLDTSLRRSLASCQWGKDRRHILRTGPPGIGTTWRACALGQQACRAGDTALSRRWPRRLAALPIATGDGRSGQGMASVATTAGLIRDDGGLAVRSDDHRRDGLEVLADRHERRSPLVTSQLPLAHWHEALGHPTLAAAILDRLGHNADKIPRKGASMRQRRAALLTQDIASTSPEQTRRRCAPMGWQLSSGMGGNLPLEQVAALHRNGWQLSSGLGGNNHRNTQGTSTSVIPH